MRSHVPSAARASLLDPSSFTLAPNGSGHKSPSPGTRSLASPTGGGGGGGGCGGRGAGERYTVQDSRWKFVNEDMFPKPRDFVGGPKRYRAGRGSSVPLDLSSL